MQTRVAKGLAGSASRSASHKTCTPESCTAGAVGLTAHLAQQHGHQLLLLLLQVVHERVHHLRGGAGQAGSCAVSRGARMAEAGAASAEASWAGAQLPGSSTVAAGPCLLDGRLQPLAALLQAKATRGEKCRRA